MTWMSAVAVLDLKLLRKVNEFVLFMRIWLIKLLSWLGRKVTLLAEFYPFIYISLAFEYRHGAYA